jgi:mannitol/fructose-specific phosphotransferase system IIA component (Ntr-type)
MAIKISKILTTDCIALNLQSSKRTAVIHEVAGQLAQHPQVSNFQSFYDELLARERLESTCLGNEVAFPHARTDHVKNMVLAAGRSKEGVLFENCGQTVKLIFVIGTPKRMVTDYLAVVGALARLLKDAPVRQRLMEAETAEDFHAVLEAEEEKL